MRSLACFQAVLGLLFLTSTAQSQSFSTTELDRYYRPGVFVPHDGMTATQRYNFRTGGIFYPGYDAQNLIMMDYLDRLDRADKFGYCPPRDPFCDPAAVPQGWRFGTGWRLFHRR